MRFRAGGRGRETARIGVEIGIRPDGELGYATGFGPYCMWPYFELALCGTSAADRLR